MARQAGRDRRPHQPGRQGLQARTVKLGVFLAKLCCGTLLLCGSAGAQQVADTSYNPPIANPAYPQGEGPLVIIDQAHFNYHTAEGRYFPFAELLRRDGYVVRVSTYGSLNAEALRDVRILVISNALHARNASGDWSLPTPSAFRDDEITALRAWVENGGSLFLIVDHMPFPGAAEQLGAAFGAQFNNGFAVVGGPLSPPGQRFILDRSGLRSEGALAEHPITNGRSAAERVDFVTTFQGCAFRMDRGAQPVLVLGPSVESYMPRVAWEFPASTPHVAVGGWLQGTVFPFGKGRVAVFGEAAMFTAQIILPQRTPMGMNHPAASQNAQFLLNVMHWLSGLLGKSEPALAAQGVVNAASFASPGVVVPGALVSMFGTNLAEGMSVASELPLPVELGGVSARIGDRSLPLLAVTEGQINAMLPFDIPVGGAEQMIVRRAGQSSAPAEVRVAGAQPGIFTTDRSGRGQGVILGAATQAIADARNPVRAGDAIVIYCAGLGAVNPAVQAGKPAPSQEPLARTVSPARVMVGGRDAVVLFAGLAPGFVGLYQVNAVAPSGVAAGDAVPVVLTVDGQSSPPVTIAVR